MPRFYERVGGGNGYVKGRVDGAFCTWQSTTRGHQKLLTSGHNHGDEIDSWLFQELINSGDLYTGNSGLTARAERVKQGRTASAKTQRRNASTESVESDETAGCLIVSLFVAWLLWKFFG